MTKEEILERWHNECHICGGHLMEGRHLHESIEVLKVQPKHANKYYTKYYVVCQACEDKGELI